MNTPPQPQPPARSALSKPELETQIAELGRWHHNIELEPGLSTFPEIGHSRRDRFHKLMTEIWPDGLDGRTFVDAACNAGAYCFWAKEIGASQTFGFDVREKWIRQAEFVLANREGPTDGMSFKAMDLYDLPSIGERRFDIAWFSGIFYHLPDPVTGLKLVADRTNDVLLISTGTLTPDGEEPEDGCLYSSFEGVKSPMSGVHHLNWFPSGPKVLTNILSWLGFPEVRLLQWDKRVQTDDRPNSRGGRLSMVASRHEGLLANVTQGEPRSQRSRPQRPAQGTPPKPGG